MKNDRETMARELGAAGVALKKGMSWSAMPPPENDPHKTVGYVGVGHGWRFVVVSFDIEDQEFPRGSRGYDGAGTHGGVLLHLPRSLAQAAFEAAEKALGAE